MLYENQTRGEAPSWFSYNMDTHAITYLWHILRVKHPCNKCRGNSLIAWPVLKDRILKKVVYANLCTLKTSTIIKCSAHVSRGITTLFSVRNGGFPFRSWWCPNCGRVAVAEVDVAPSKHCLILCSLYCMPVLCALNFENEALQPILNVFNINDIKRIYKQLINY